MTVSYSATMLPPLLFWFCASLPRAQAFGNRARQENCGALASAGWCAAHQGRAGVKMRAVFVDGDAASGRIYERLAQAGDPPVHIHLDPDVDPQKIPDVLAGAEIAI